MPFISFSFENDLDKKVSIRQNDKIEHLSLLQKSLNQKHLHRLRDVGKILVFVIRW